MLKRIASRLVVTSVASLAACAAPGPPRPFAPPPRSATLDHFAGSVLGGPLPAARAAVLDAGDADAPLLRCRVLVVESLDLETGEPVISRAELVAATLGGEPIQVAAELAERARWFGQDRAAALLDGWNQGAGGRIVQVGTLATALPLDVTAEVTTAGPSALAVAGVDALRPSTAVLVSHVAAEGGSAFSLALLVQDLVVDPAADPSDSADLADPDGDDGDDPDDDGAAAPLPTVLRRDVLVLGQRPVPGGGPVVLAAPIAVPDAADAALVFVLELAPAAATDPDHAALVARAIAEVRAAAHSAEQRGAALAPAETSLSEYRRALAALAEPSTRRATLLYLAGVLRAPFAQDFALVADETLLAAACAALQARLGDLRQLRGSPADLGWTLEREAWAFAARELAEDRLDVAVEGVLLRHAGEAGHFASSIDDALAGSADAAALERRFEEENRIFLEDSNPAARVRAYDWLALRGLAPADYDPLAAAAGRRAALRRAEEAAAEPAAPAAGARP